MLRRRKGVRSSHKLTTGERPAGVFLLDMRARNIKRGFLKTQLFLRCTIKVLLDGIPAALHEDSAP